MKTDQEITSDIESKLAKHSEDAKVRIEARRLYDNICRISGDTVARLVMSECYATILSHTPDAVTNECKHSEVAKELSLLSAVNMGFSSEPLTSILKRSSALAEHFSKAFGKAVFQAEVGVEILRNT